MILHQGVMPVIFHPMLPSQLQKKSTVLVATSIFSFPSRQIQGQVLLLIFLDISIEELYSVIYQGGYHGNVSRKMKCSIDKFISRNLQRNVSWNLSRNFVQLIFIHFSLIQVRISLIENSMIPLFLDTLLETFSTIEFSMIRTP